MFKLPKMYYSKRHCHESLLGSTSCFEHTHPIILGIFSSRSGCLLSWGSLAVLPWLPRCPELALNISFPWLFWLWGKASHHTMPDPVGKDTASCFYGPTFLLDGAGQRPSLCFCSHLIKIQKRLSELPQKVARMAGSVCSKPGKGFRSRFTTMCLSV